jgi:hypothetical protein
MAKVSGNKTEREELVAMLGDDLSQVRVERILRSAATRLQRGYAGNILGTVSESIRRSTDDSDRAHAIVFAGTWLYELGKHGRTWEQVRDAVVRALET